MIEPLYQLTILLGGLGLLMVLVVQGRSIFVAAPLSAFLTVMLSGVDPVATLCGPYLSGLADYFRNFYFVFVLGAAFGKLFDQSGAARTIAARVAQGLGRDHACLAVVLACAILTYGGVSLFVVGFSVYPLAVQLFRTADLPRRFIPAAIAFGSITFTMTSAGSPEIQNLIPIKYLIDTATGTPLSDARAGWPVSLIVAGFMFISGQFYLQRAILKARKAGEGWEEFPPNGKLPHHSAGPLEPSTKRRSASLSDRGDKALEGRADTRAKPTHRRAEAGTHAAAEGGVESTGSRGSTNDGDPTLLAAVFPLLVTLFSLNLLPLVCHQLARGLTWQATSGPVWSQLRALLAAFPEEPTLSIFLGVLAGLWVFRRQLKRPWSCLGDGFLDGLIAIGSTASVVGFGAAVKGLPAFGLIVDAVTRIPGDPLIGAAIAVAVISAVAGSASGGQGIALPIIKPIYVDQLGVAPRALHRVVAISSGTLDTLPANGFLVMLVRHICGETHQRAYPPIFVLSVLLPLAGTALAVLLFKLIPSWGWL
jgi:H+/gluconate symporter-like permease